MNAGFASLWAYVRSWEAMRLPLRIPSPFRFAL